PGFRRARGPALGAPSCRSAPHFADRVRKDVREHPAARQIERSFRFARATGNALPDALTGLRTFFLRRLATFVALPSGTARIRLAETPCLEPVHATGSRVRGWKNTSRVRLGPQFSLLTYRP